MVAGGVPPALQERLGPEGTMGLLALFDAARNEWAAAVTNLAVERFERRLTEELSGLRIGIAQGDAALRVELTQEVAQLRVEFKQEMCTLRTEMSNLRVELKDEMSRVQAGVRESLLTMTRWTFGLWVGQLVATAAIVAGMFQIFAQ